MLSPWYTAHSFCSQLLATISSDYCQRKVYSVAILPRSVHLPQLSPSIKDMSPKCRCVSKMKTCSVHYCIDALSSLQHFLWAMCSLIITQEQRVVQRFMQDQNVASPNILYYQSPPSWRIASVMVSKCRPYISPSYFFTSSHCSCSHPVYFPMVV